MSSINSHRLWLVSIAKTTLETCLRLPALILLELWWQKRRIDEILPTPITAVIANQTITSYLEVSRILAFVHTRNFDQSAAEILSYSVLFLAALILLLPMVKLVLLYLHAISFLLFGFAHYMSIRYVQLEQASGGEVQLDDFVKLERHGFHFLAQVMLALAVNCLLHIESELARISLAIFSAPIVARMCGFPIDRLMVVHNFACTGAMLIICCYLLNTAPALVLWLRRTYRQVRAILVVRGPIAGTMAIWRRLRIPSLLMSAWLTLFTVRVYVEVHSGGGAAIRAIDYPALVLAAIAESTGSPISLLGLAITVSCACKMAVHGARVVLIIDDPPTAVLHSGYTEGLTLVLLCAQTGLLSMSVPARAFLLGLVLFIVMSALMQNLFELLEPHLLTLGASHHAQRTRHLRALLLAAVCFTGPIAITVAIGRFLPLDLWCVIIVSNCLLTSLQTLSTVVTYALFLVESRATQPWHQLDDVIFYCKAVTRALELALALLVIAYGIYASLVDQWSYMSMLVLVFHCYFNVWRRLQSGWKAFQMRRKAAANMQTLAKASATQLHQLADVCAICFNDMVDEARVTPCNHFFHGACLRKWLFVKATCPLCHTDINTVPSRRRAPVGRRDNSEEGYSSEYDSSDSDAHTTDTEYTMASSDNAF